MNAETAKTMGNLSWLAARSWKEPGRHRSLRLEPLEDRRLLSLVPELVKDINLTNVGLGPSQLTNVNGTLFFVADDGTSGRELWKSDGTAAGAPIFAQSHGELLGHITIPGSATDLFPGTGVNTNDIGCFVAVRVPV